MIFRNVMCSDSTALVVYTTFRTSSGNAKPVLILAGDQDTTTLPQNRPDAGVGVEQSSQLIERACLAGEHSAPFTTNTITIGWTAPASASGNIDLYVAAWAANGNTTKTGDHIYTSSFDPNARSPASAKPLHQCRVPIIFRRLSEQ
jgi:hypothetical protein